MDADFFLVNSKVLALAQRSNAFSLSCGRDGVQEFVLSLPPPWVQQLVTENDCDLPAACLAALPVRSPKKGDWRTGLSCALREKLPKKARLCEVLSALEGILDSKKAVMERGRWQVLLGEDGRACALRACLELEKLSCWRHSRNEEEQERRQGSTTERPTYKLAV